MVFKKINKSVKLYVFLIHKNLRREVHEIIKNTKKKLLAESLAKSMKHVLKMEANSASCCILNQPKAPKKLRDYK